MLDDSASSLEQMTEAQVLADLSRIPHLAVQRNVLLKDHTRFAVGGPASIFAETAQLESLVQAVAVCDRSGLPYCLIGEGSNLIASDQGYRGIVLRWTARTLNIKGRHVKVDAGTALRELVDATVKAGLAGLQTLAGIPGSVGAAIYGNAGAYGHSISEAIVDVSILDAGAVRQLERIACHFHYRDSVFKQNKNWLILGAELQLEFGHVSDLQQSA